MNKFITAFGLLLLTSCQEAPGDDTIFVFGTDIRNCLYICPSDNLLWISLDGDCECWGKGTYTQERIKILRECRESKK